MKIINNISRNLVGIVFIFSGFVKGIDPLGSAYKFGDYFNAFGLEFLEPTAFSLAILLSSLEFIIGFSLIFSTKKNLTAWAVLLFMSFFTILTFILAIFNPVTDCGCFGDAIIMTNWQTFLKNIVLMVFTLILFINRYKYQPNWSNSKQWSVVSIPAIFIVLVSVYCYRHLPLIDFMPYTVGTYIPEKMAIPDDAPSAEYKTSLIYTKDGKNIEVDLNNLPDSTWQWVETKQELIQEGYVPPIHDFVIQSMTGDDITDIILNENKFTILLVAYNLKNTKLSDIIKINALAEYCDSSNNCNFICLTSSLQSEIDEFTQKTNAKYPFFNTDEITLKTMIRANPGLVILKRGWIIDKWNALDTPDLNGFIKNLINNPKYKTKSNENESENEDLNV